MNAWAHGAEAARGEVESKVKWFIDEVMDSKGTLSHLGQETSLLASVSSFVKGD